MKSDNKLVKILACETDKGIVLNVVNSGDLGANLILTLPAGYKSDHMETLYAPDKLSRTYPDHSDIKFEVKEIIKSSEIIIKPLSINRISFSKIK